MKVRRYTIACCMQHGWLKWERQFALMDITNFIVMEVSLESHKQVASFLISAAATIVISDVAFRILETSIVHCNIYLSASTGILMTLHMKADNAKKYKMHLKASHLHYQEWKPIILLLSVESSSYCVHLFTHTTTSQQINLVLRLYCNKRMTTKLSNKH